MAAYRPSVIDFKLGHEVFAVAERVAVFMEEKQASIVYIIFLILTIISFIPTAFSTQPPSSLY